MGADFLPLPLSGFDLALLAISRGDEAGALSAYFCAHSRAVAS